MDLQMRPLKANDAMDILNLLGKLNVVEGIKDIFNGEKRDKIIEFAQDAEDEEKATQIGLLVFAELADLIVKNVPQHRAEVYALLADVYQTDVQTIENLTIKDFAKLIIDFLKHEDFSELLESVTQSIK